MKILNKLQILTLLSLIFAVYSCGKNMVTPSSVKNSATAKSDPLVMTPKGLIPASHTHLIENNYHLEIRNGHVLKVETKTQKVAQDFGERIPPSSDNVPQQNNSGEQLNNITKPVAPYSAITNWITYGEWQNPTSSPINYFTTNWTVPTGAMQFGGQLIFIFNALQPAEISDNIIQPVLQWGAAANGGGNYWCIDNWYGWEDASGNLQFAYQPLVEVSAGTNLQGVITYTGQQAGTGSYNYTSSFYYNSTSLTMNVVDGDIYHQAIPVVPLNKWAFETLEAYKSANNVELSSVYYYPDQALVAMTGINLTTVVSNSPGLSWHCATGTNSIYGEHASSTTSSEVDLHFSSFSFLVSTGDSPSIYFTLQVNGGTPTSTFRIGSGLQSYVVNMLCNDESNSTIVMNIPDAGGIMPTSATLYNLGAPIQGVFSGRNITFSGANLTSYSSAQIVVN